MNEKEIIRGWETVEKWALEQGWDDEDDDEYSGLTEEEIDEIEDAKWRGER